MAARASIQEVRDVIYLSSDFTDQIVAQSIAAATVIVTSKILPNETDYDLLKQIELYLAAHFCSVREPQLIREEIGGRDSTAKEERKSAMSGYGFASTAFGQQAIALDPTGYLGSMTSQRKKTAGFNVYGPYEEE